MQLMRNGAARPRAWLASFALPAQERSQQHLLDSAVALGEFAAIRPWSLTLLQQRETARHYPRFAALLSDPALGLWRPAVILEQLRQVADGDVVLYHDAGQGYWGD